jgi:hypothetical protein
MNLIIIYYQLKKNPMNLNEISVNDFNLPYDDDYKNNICLICGEKHRNRKDNYCNKCRFDIKCRTCSICGEKHRNRKDNYCNKCRGGIVGFGIHKGKSYLYVYTNYQEYINWLISNQEKLIIAKKYYPSRLDNLRMERMEKMFSINKGVLQFIEWCKLKEIHF